MAPLLAYAIAVRGTSSLWVTAASCADLPPEAGAASACSASVGAATMVGTAAVDADARPASRQNMPVKSMAAEHGD
ncbi:hypothetical protein V8C86DRAFT_2615448 [Haematococcus lacustris]